MKWLTLLYCAPLLAVPLHLAVFLIGVAEDVIADLRRRNRRP